MTWKTRKAHKCLFAPRAFKKRTRSERVIFTLLERYSSDEIIITWSPNAKKHTEKSDDEPQLFKWHGYEIFDCIPLTSLISHFATERATPRISEPFGYIVHLTSLGHSLFLYIIGVAALKIMKFRTHHDIRLLSRFAKESMQWNIRGDWKCSRGSHR